MYTFWSPLGDWRRMGRRGLCQGSATSPSSCRSERWRTTFEVDS